MSKDTSVDELKSKLESFVHDSLRTRSEAILEQMKERVLRSDAIRKSPDVTVRDTDSEVYINSKKVDFHISVDVQTENPERLLAKLNSRLSRMLIQMASDINPAIETTGNAFDKFEIVYSGDNFTTFEFTTSVDVW